MESNHSSSRSRRTFLQNSILAGSAILGISSFPMFAETARAAPLNSLLAPLASTGSSLTGFSLSVGGFPRAYYLGINRHIYELSMSGKAWRYLDVMSEAGNAPVASVGSSLVGFSLPNGKPRVYYLADDGHVHELAWTGKLWGHRDLMADAGNAPIASAGSALTGFSMPNGDPRVYYLGSNSHVHELAWVGRWSHRDVTFDSGNAPVASAASALTGFSMAKGKPRVYYVSTNSHVCELAWNGKIWSHRDVMVDAGNAPAAWTSSTLTSFALPNGNPRVYYLGPNSHVCELAWDGKVWKNQDVMAGTENVPSAWVGSMLAGFSMPNGTPRIYYLSSDGHVHELAWTGKVWGYRDVSADAGNAPSASAGSELASFSMSNGNPHVYYLGTNSHVYELAINGKAWGYRDVTNDAV